MQKLLTGSFILRYNNIRRQRGGIAQLGERLNGIHEVAGSIPTPSTTEITELRNFAKLFFVFSKNFSKNIATAGSFGHCITYLHIVLLFSIMDLQTIAR